MKKNLLLLATTLISSVSFAQLPANSFASYEFTNGSLNNTSQTTASDLSGTFMTVADRNSSNNDAVLITEKLTGANLGASNINTTTIGFWVKKAPMNSNQRVLQVYGVNGSGYRVEIDGTNVLINSRVESAAGHMGQSMQVTANIDDNNWHHIVVRTGPSSTNDAIIYDLFIDGVDANLPSNVISVNGSVTNFLTNATFLIDPLDGEYTGRIDDIYLYTSVLSDAEVIQLYNYYPAPPPTRFYVDTDATGNNDGTSWQNAYTDVRDAFLNAVDGMEIWVAEGVYKRSGTNRDFSLGWVADSIKLYGGFNGTETALNQRDWRNNATIFSGDIGVVGDNSDNTYTALAGPIGTSSNIINYALIDGIIAQDGNADHNNSYESRRRGGGFYSYEYVKKTDLRNCTFRNNNALYGGAICVENYYVSKTINFENCIITENTGVYAASLNFAARSGNGINATINNCLVHNNAANSSASGVNQVSSIYTTVHNHVNFNLDITNSTFVNNQNSYTGTGEVNNILVYSETSQGTKNITIENSIFWDNSQDDNLVGLHSSSVAGGFNSVIINNSISDITSSESFYSESSVLNQDPLFYSLLNQDFTLQSSSPAINAGTQNGVTILTTDLAGNPRVSGTSIDMGCYESQSGSPSSINDNTNFELVCYPNPTNGVVSFQSRQNIEKIEVYTLTGQKVNQFNNVSTIDLTNLPNGIYTVKVFSASNNLIIKKIAKH